MSVPWKNGGGTTRQLAVEPADATSSDFLWRISIAQIDAPGEFSAFPGIDRTILLWRGDGVTLRSSAWPNHRIDDPRTPFFFHGEEDVVCDLLGGPTLDLNLMVRRGKVDTTFKVIDEARYSVPVCDDFFLLCSQGSAQFVESDCGRVVDIGAAQLLRASKVDERQAVVIASGEALLVGIAIRLMGESQNRAVSSSLCYKTITAR
jgi:environmental stress-induced protein Ves